MIRGLRGHWGLPLEGPALALPFLGGGLLTRDTGGVWSLGTGKLLRFGVGGNRELM